MSQKKDAHKVAYAFTRVGDVYVNNYPPNVWGAAYVNNYPAISPEIQMSIKHLYMHPDYNKKNPDINIDYL